MQAPACPAFGPASNCSIQRSSYDRPVIALEAAAHAPAVRALRLRSFDGAVLTARTAPHIRLKNGVLHGNDRSAPDMPCLALVPGSGRGRLTMLSGNAAAALQRCAALYRMLVLLSCLDRKFAYAVLVEPSLNFDQPKYRVLGIAEFTAADMRKSDARQRLPHGFFIPQP